MFKPAKARDNPRWEQLRQQFRRILRRNLTEQEERLLELSQALLEDEQLDLAASASQSGSISKVPEPASAPPYPPRPGKANLESK